MKSFKKIFCMIMMFLLVTGCINVFGMEKGGIALEKSSKKNPTQKLSIFINQAAVEIIKSENDNIKTEYDKSLYDVRVKTNGSETTVDVKSKSGNNSALPVKLYVPEREWNNINLSAKKASVECYSVFDMGNILVDFDSSNIEFELSTQFEGTFKGDSKSSNLNFISLNKYKDFDVKIINLSGMVEVPGYFKKRKNVYSYSNGKKTSSIFLTVNDDGMTEFE